MGILFLWLMFPAFANAERPEGVAVTVGDTKEAYEPVASGTELQFETPGPKKVIIESRRRMAGPAQRSRAAPLEALGDGQLILTIKVPGSAVANGSIGDVAGGFPSKSDRSAVTVPPGGSVLTIRAPAGGPDFLIRVTDRQGNIIHPIGSGLPSPKSPPPVATATPKPASPLKPNTALQPTAKASKLVAAAGINTGIGLASRGSRVVPHVAATARLPLHADLISAGVAFGYHRISVNESHTVAVPFGGYATQLVQYSTTVLPIEAHVGIHVPTGAFHTVATAGVTMSVAIRNEDGDKLTNVALGPSIGTGVEFDAGPGIVRPMLEWSDGRTRFGNINTDGEQVRETLSVGRISIQYLFPI